MRRLPTLLCVLLALSAGAMTACTPEQTSSKAPGEPDGGADAPGGKGDYFGEDDRKQPRELAQGSQALGWARSTALLAEADDIVEGEDGGLKLDATNFGESRNLCEDAHFADEPSVSGCSSFLVAPDIMVTAGHCVHQFFSCEDARFVFDYGYYDEGQDPTRVTEDQIYRCDEVIASKYEGNELDQLDYGVVRLKRPVEGREPLELRDEGTVQPGAHLTLIGYPDGIPVKIDGGGVVFHVTDKRFVATNDSFSGHSGSAVVNSQTGRVEAVHVASGGQRFVRDEEQDCRRARQCQQANVDGDSECQGSIGVHVDQWRHHVEGSGDGDTGTGDVGTADTGDTGTADTGTDVGGNVGSSDAGETGRADGGDS